MYRVRWHVDKNHASEKSETHPTDVLSRVKCSDGLASQTDS